LAPPVDRLNVPDAVVEGSQPQSHTAILVAAAIAASLNPLNSTMVAVTLPALSAEFAASASSVTVTVVTAYLVATLIFQVPAGSIADRIGYSRALGIGRLLFLAGAVAGAVAPALWLVVVARLVMAVGGSLNIPTAMALVRVAVPENRRGRAFGTLGAVLAGAAAIGPAIGAWMSSHFGWRTLFLINVPMIAASYAAQWLSGRDIDTQTTRRSPAPAFDWLGSALIGATLVLLTFATRAASPLAWWLAAIGIAAGLLQLWHERRVPSPVLRLSLFGERTFVAGSGVVATQNLAMYSLVLLVPFLFGSSSGADPQLGLAIIAMTATMAATSPLGGWLADRFGARAIVSAGGLSGALGVVGLIQLSPGSSAVAIGARLLLVGLGLGLSTGPAQAAALRAVPATHSGIAAATVSMLRYLGAVVGTVVISYAVSDGAGADARHRVALIVFATSFAISAGLGAWLTSEARRP
jgi:MFS family permease